MNTIKVSSKSKSTTIRLSWKTKRFLEAMAQGKETHEEILLRLINLANHLQTQEGHGGGTTTGFGYDDDTGDSTTILKRGDVIGTSYARRSSTFIIEYGNKNYEAVCTYNDLTTIALLRMKKLKNALGLQTFDWELDPELVNVKINEQWASPDNLNEQERRMLTLICVKQILEETFNVKLFELVSEEDYISASTWKKAYDRNGFSRDSLNADILKVLE